ncbi:MAG: hypothetical protein K8I27_14850 [Planctomycetes bacterium]|nr:hypothetical protein [Planctomycetota bacterium]
MTKKILYIDMDNVLVEFQSAFPRVDPALLAKHKDDEDEVPGIFSLMDPKEGALEAYTTLSELFDTYILSTSPWENPSAWADKLLWVKKHLGGPAYKRLILSHHKNLNRGHFLVDDRDKNGADRFEGELIRLHEDHFKTWSEVLDYLVPQAT